MKRYDIHISGGGGFPIEAGMYEFVDGEYVKFTDAREAVIDGLEEIRGELTELLKKHLAKEIGPTIYDRAYDVGKKDTLQTIIRGIDNAIRDRRNKDD